MSNDSFTLLTPLLFLLLGMGQGGLWLMWRRHTECVWLGGSFFALSAGIVVQLVTRSWPFWLHILSFSVLYLVATAMAGLALAQRLRVRMPWRGVLLLGLLAFAEQMWFTVVQPSLPMRVALFSILALMLMGLPLLYWRSMHLSNRFDHLLRWLYVLCIVSNIARTLLQLPQAHVAVAEHFMQSGFWLVLHVFAMFSGMALAGCLFFAVLRDVLDLLHTDRDTDALTQLLNRRGWQARLAQLEAQHASAQRPECSLLLADIDYFKQTNDQFGHAAGDQVLQQVAKLLQQQVRGHDAVCRHGGEEFVVLLVGANLQAARQVAERIRQQTQQATMPALGGQAVTISIGLSPLQGLTAHDVAQAIEAADRQLYVAKHAGRNQIAVACEIDEASELLGHAI